MQFKTIASFFKRTIRMADSLQTNQSESQSNIVMKIYSRVPSPLKLLFPRYPFSAQAFSPPHLRLNTGLEDDYQTIAFLGKGSSARVFQGLNVLNHQKVVVKMFKSLPPESIQAQIKHNLKLMSNLPPQNQHIQFIKMIDILINQGCGSYTLIFDFCPGAPLNMLVEKLKLKDSLAYMKDIAQTIAYVHSLGIVHRDIKPSNILLSRGRAKLFDFGLAKQNSKETLTTRNFGTKCYKVPECLFRFDTYDQKADIWAMGLTFAEMLLNHRHIIEHKNDAGVLSQVASLCNLKKEDLAIVRPELRQNLTVGRYRSWVHLAEKKNLSKDIIELVRRMLEFNPEKRPTAQEVRHSAIFNDLTEGKSQ